MIDSLCQKFTAGIQEVLELTKDFDEHEETGSFIPELYALQNNINDKLDTILSKYQDFRWPMERFPRIQIVLEGKTEARLLEELKQRGIPIFLKARSMLSNISQDRDFRGRQNKIKPITLIKVKVGDLGYKKVTESKKVFRRAQHLGLKLCPVETGIYLALQKQVGAADDFQYQIASFPISRGEEKCLFVLWKNNFGSISIDSTLNDEERPYGLEQEMIFCL